MFTSTKTVAGTSALSVAKRDIESDGTTFIANGNMYVPEDPVDLLPPNSFLKEKNTERTDITQRVAHHFEKCCTGY